MNDFRIVKTVFKWDLKMKLRKVSGIWMKWGVKMLGDNLIMYGFCYDFVKKFSEYLFLMCPCISLITSLCIYEKSVDIRIFNLKKIICEDINDLDEYFDLCGSYGEINLKLLKNIQKIVNFDLSCDNTDIVYNYSGSIVKYVWYVYELKICGFRFIWNDMCNSRQTNEPEFKYLYFIFNIIGIEKCRPKSDISECCAGRDRILYIFRRCFDDKKLLLSLVKRNCFDVDVYFPMFVFHCYGVEMDYMKEVLWKVNGVCDCVGKCGDDYVVDKFWYLFRN